MKQQLKGKISIRLHITTSDKLILNLTRNARNEIVTNEIMNKTNTNHNSPCTCFQGPTQCVEYFIFLVKTIYLRETGGINAKGLKLHNAIVVNNRLQSQCDLLFSTVFLACEKIHISSLFALLGTSRMEECLQLSGRNSIMVTQISVYIINLVVIGFQ